MAKRHIPRRYQKKAPPAPAFTLTGNAFLHYEEDEAIESAGKGDVFLTPHLERGDYGDMLPDYHATGKTGYYKIMVQDGKGWKPLLPEGVFAAKEHHFRKKDMPWDSFLLCRQQISELAGRPVARTYREHYIILDSPSADSPTANNDK